MEFRMKKLTIELHGEGKSKEWQASMDDSKPIWKAKTLFKLLGTILRYAKGQNL